MSIESGLSLQEGIDPASAGVISRDDHYTEGNIHLVSSVAALDTFWDVPEAERVESVLYIPAASDRFAELGLDDQFARNEKGWLSDQLGRGALHKVQEIALRTVSLKQLKAALKSSDAVFVGAGNTQYLLEALRRIEADKILRDFVSNRAVMYLGRSAGAIVAGPDIRTRGTFWPSMAYAPIENYTALGLIDAYPVPHIDLEADMNRAHAVSGRTGWQVAMDIAAQHPAVFLTDALSTSPSED